ncbi:MAG: translation initiation factor eIF-2B [Nanoarchaeota archaeon]|nr:translation initiation factor eIF-2B [Nanoarchaeota archaeon]MBU0962537.1 translation initiation factor eIF-2B [Nanoarchaeota archaeon]
MNFNQICKAIKEVEIQGAENIAKAAIKAYYLNPTKAAVRKLISLRPTEPCLRNALNFVQLDKGNITKALIHFEESDFLISEYGSKLIQNESILYTHCHSSTVINMFKHAKEKGKRFLVRNTETRPLLQGRITSKELSRLKIPNSHFVDSAMRFALKKCDMVFIGADAITSEGKVINKIGSEMACEIAKKYDIPVYICTNSWKFDPKTIFGFPEIIEKRPKNEVWSNPPRGVNIINPAFEKIDPDLITAIISELGILKPENFLMQVQKKYPWMIK